MIDVRPIPEHRAAQAFAGLAHLDPRGMATEEDMQRIGEGCECLRVVLWDGERPKGCGVMVMARANGVAWIEGASGWGEGLTEAMHEVAKAWGKSHGCTSVGCQTKRRGLVARLQRAGWEPAGWIMKASIQ